MSRAVGFYLIFLRPNDIGCERGFSATPCSCGRALRKSGPWEGTRVRLDATSVFLRGRLPTRYAGYSDRPLPGQRRMYH